MAKAKIKTAPVLTPAARAPAATKPTTKAGATRTRAAKTSATKTSASKTSATNTSASKSSATKTTAKAGGATKAGAPKAGAPKAGATTSAAKISASKTSATSAPVPSEAASALLAAILAMPGDTKARLVYADWLQDHGDPRGELIVVQCQRAELPADDPRATELLAREAELFKKCKKTWTAVFGTAPGARWEYRRGFVEKLSIDAEPLAKHGPAIFAAEPVEELNVWKIDESKVLASRSRLAPVLALAGLSRVRRLSLARSKLSKADIDALATATTLGNVESLDLSICELDADSLEELQRATSLPRLRELKLAGNFVTDMGVRELAGSSTLHPTHLVLARCELGPGGAAAIANARWASQLVHLDLSSNSIRTEGMRELAASPHLTALRSLKLEYCDIDDDAVDAILDSPTLARLEHLDLSTNLSGDAIARIHERFGERLYMRYARH